MQAKLHAFLYLLLRDHLPAGEVEKLVHSAELAGERVPVFSNSGLEEYAAELEHRLLSAPPLRQYPFDEGD